MKRTYQVFDLRHRFDWNNRGTTSPRNVYPWDQMRVGDGVILPVCTKADKQVDLFPKHARKSLSVFLKSKRARAWHKKTDLVLSVQRLPDGDHRGQGYLCRIVPKDPSAQHNVRPRLRTYQTIIRELPPLRAALETDEETWARELREARRIKGANPGSEVTAHRHLNYITVEDEEEGARLYANPGAMAFLKDLKEKVTVD